jgi:hypothetical protein
MRLLACALFTSLAWGAGLPDVHAVYVLPMAGGLDQFLASRLSSADLFRVVTDPQKADAIFTDQLGATFEQKLVDLYPPPKPADAKPDKDKDKDDGRPQIHAYSGGHVTGSIFLVDRASRTVIWSSYEKPAKQQPSSLDDEAKRIVVQIQKQKKKT